jgi:ectoine hydroxylase-related dioxygenase (phytanoyl-CoA dioxygenase family)
MDNSITTQEAYQRDGYLFLGRVVSRAELELARVNLDRMIANLYPGFKPDEIYSAHQQEKWLLKIAACKPLLDNIESQIGPNIVLWSTHLICKPPRTGRAIPWHQDRPYWNTTKLSGSVWLAFDDVDESNGTMFVLPGWHKADLRRRSTGDDFFDEEIDPAALPPNVHQLEVPYRLKAGEAAVHDTMMPHRSSPNKSDRWRRVLVCRYMAADGETGAKEYPDYRTGEMFPRKYLLVRGEDVLNRGFERVQLEH